MQSGIVFLQSIELGSKQPGLFELLCIHLNSLKYSNVFEKIQIAVPNYAHAIWLKDKITEVDGICANLDVVVLLGPILQNIYHGNNPDTQIFDFTQTKYIIYKYLCTNQIDTVDSTLLNKYIFNNDGILDKYRTYQLATQLQQIFQEYLYLRTDELMNHQSAKIPDWQKQILTHLFEQIGEQKTFLDIYKYFLTTDLNLLILPKQLFIFGLTSVYPSQLRIIKKISQKVIVYWYYQLCSYNYYGDLLSIKTKTKLEQKILKNPYLSLDDLYLTDGNPLLANLGQQSREFIELLNANEVDIYNFNIDPPITNSINTCSLLELLQNDIRAITYRIELKYRLGNNLAYYADPVELDNPCGIKINSCHNKMREVQVMFNEVIDILNTNPMLRLEDILITAPDIDDYVTYITAVFDNETAQDNNGHQYKILYNITGERRQENYKILECIKLILNAPYHLPVSYFIEILTQIEIRKNLEIDINDIELVKKWLQDNKVYFGYDANDYAVYGYENYDVHSFRHWLNNLVLGACMNDDMFITKGILPILITDTREYTPYDNLDSSQIALCNRLIILLDILQSVRDIFYVGADNFKELELAQVYDVLNGVNKLLLKDEYSITLCELFLGHLLDIQVTTTITLPILNMIIDDYINNFTSRINLNGNITCASMRYMRNIPFEYIYVLGMNFGEFPTIFNPNKLSLLSHEWYLADRNYNIEDKQTFLDILLSAKQQIVFSYIGRNETDNKEIKPSPILELLLTTIGKSCTNFWSANDPIQQKYDYSQILFQQSLHPFYTNHQKNYSMLWSRAAQLPRFESKISRWNFSKTLLLDLTTEQNHKYLTLNIYNLVKTFLYTNVNMYSILGIDVYDNEVSLDDFEGFNFTNRSIAKSLYNYFEKYMTINERQLYNYLKIKGVVGYADMGLLQYEYYLKLYNFYKEKRGETMLELNFNYQVYMDNKEFNLTIHDKVWVVNNNIIIIDDFCNIDEKELPNKLLKVPYKLRIKSLIVYLVLYNGAVNNKIKPDKVILRCINAKLECRDFVVMVTDLKLVQDILEFYLRSLCNPVLIHNGAIDAYAVDKDMKKAQDAYMNEFNNVDLDKIKQDIVFGSIANDYFEHIALVNGNNDIQTIGNILAYLVDEKSS